MVVLFACTSLIVFLSFGKTEEPLTVQFNEVCSNNFSTAPLNEYENSDWIELYNVGDETINLNGWSVSDDSGLLKRFFFDEIMMKPGEYLLLYATGEEGVTEEGIFLPFKLSEEETLVLYDENEILIDSVIIPKTKQNTTYARTTEFGVWTESKATPGSYNEEAFFISDVLIEAPQFSVDSGFYSKDVYLELMAEEGNDIYYTLDGSEPTTESTWYIEPILLSDRSGEENILSSRNDFSTDDAYDDFPLEPVDKIHVVRAIAVDSMGNSSEIATASYGIGYDDKTEFIDIWTVSLVSDPTYWFDRDNGLYIRGSAYDEVFLPLVESGMEWDEAGKIVDMKPNYQLEGKTSERPGYIEIYNENQECILKQNVGLRVHGHTTRKLSQKSWSIYSREMYDGKDYFENDIFGKGMQYPKLMIYNDRDETKARQKLIAKLLKEQNVATQEFIYCNVFLDGEYWGLYTLAEVYNEEYVENHYGVKKENVILSNNAIPSELQEIAINEAGLPEEELIQQLMAKIDLNSYIEYYAAMVFLNNKDWLPHNGYAWRSSTISDDNPYEDGKYRFMVYDTELTISNYDENTFDGGYVWTTRDDPVFTILMKEDFVQEQFVDKMYEYAETVFEQENVLQCLESIEKERAQAISLQAQRWGYYWREEKNYEELEEVREFFKNRKNYILDYMEEEFK